MEQMEILDSRASLVHRAQPDKLAPQAQWVQPDPWEDLVNLVHLEPLGLWDLRDQEETLDLLVQLDRQGHQEIRDSLEVQDFQDLRELLDQ